MIGSYAIIPPHYHLSTPHPRAPIAAIVTIGIGDDFDRSAALSEAVWVPNADGSSSTDNCQNTWYFDEHTSDTHSHGHHIHHPLATHHFMPLARERWQRLGP